MMLTLLLGGCGGDGAKDTQDTPAASARALPCPVVVDESGWREFLALAGRIETGEAASRTDLEQLAAQPSFVRWSASFPDAGRPTPVRITNWLERTFAEEMGLETKRKLNVDLRTFVRSYRWSLDHSDVIDQRLGQWRDGLWCSLDQQLRLWIPAASMVDTLRVDVLPGRPELRFHEGRIYVDSGVLAAGHNAQLQGQITALTYRNLAAIGGPSPLELEGTEAISHLFRVVTNEAIATWLEDLPNTVFEPQHPSLRKVRPVPEDFWNSAIRVLDSLDRHLPGVLDDPDAQASRTAEIVRGAAGGGLTGQGSWCMANTIAEVLGEERLRQVAHSVPAFVSAYQEATAGNTPRPALRDVPGAYHRAMPHFSPETWDRLLPLLEAAFPEGS